MELLVLSVDSNEQRTKLKYFYYVIMLIDLSIQFDFFFLSKIIQIIYS